MKKCVKLIFGLLLACCVGGFTACENLPFGNNNSDSESVESTSSEATSLESASSQEESSSEDSSSLEEESSTNSTLDDSSSSGGGGIHFPWWPWGSDETSDSTSEEYPDSDSSESSEDIVSSDSSESSEDIVSSDSSESSDSSSEDIIFPDPPMLPVKQPDCEIDLTSNLISYAPMGYGVTADLVEVAYGYDTILKGTFNNVGADTYPGEDGGRWVWTCVSLDIPSINDGHNAYLRNMALSFQIKTVNCSPVSSIILYDEITARSVEVPFQNQGLEDKVTFEPLFIEGDWCKFTVNLPLIYNDVTLDNVSQIDIIFSNAYGNNALDSVFYLDDVMFVTPSHAWTNPTVYNHEGYYDKDEVLSVMFAGNSFIEYSQSAYWLNTIAQNQGANLTANYTWTPNGRIPDQYDNAFGYNGYMTQAEKPDVVFIQDFYELSDALYLGDYLSAMASKSSSTEVIVYTADNETEDGIIAAEHYGLDLVNWREAIHTMKNELGFTGANLNYPDGALHANELNGVFGAAMAYMQLYGEIPNADELWNDILTAQGRYGDNVIDFLPGSTLEEKQTYLFMGLRLCAELCGFDADNICLHQYNYKTILYPSCQTDGWEKGVCVYCSHKIERILPATGHIYEDGVCIYCSVLIPTDPYDLATTEYLTTSIIDHWIMHADLTMQSKTVSQNSTSALRGSFNVANADEWYDSSQDPSGDGGPWVWTVVTLDLATLYNGSADLRTATLTFDIKVINGDSTSSIILLKSDGTRATQLPFNQSPNNPNVSALSGYTKMGLTDGWVRITADFNMLYGADASAVDKLYLIISNAYGNYEEDTVFYLDNMYLSDTLIAEENDFANTAYASNQPLGAWMVNTHYSMQSDVVSVGSSTALKGEFALEGASDWYDSTQDPNGDGGMWVWTACAFDLAQVGGPSNLNGVTWTFDVKAVNCSPTSSVTVYHADGTFPTEKAFNNTATDTSPLQSGMTKTVLEDGWVRITVDFDALFTAEQLMDVEKIIIIFSNAYSDYENTNVFYLDNMQLS